MLSVLAGVGLTACGSPQHTKTLTISFTHTTVLKAGTPVAVNVGDTLTAAPGTWTGNPTYSYQWQHCNSDASSCSNITGATSQTYTVASTDGGYYLRVAVTATRKAHGSRTAYSALTGQVPGTTTTTSSTTTPSGGTGCFSDPGSCGYPTTTSVGSTTACSSLTTLTSSNVPAGWSLSSGELQPSADGTAGSPNTLSGYNFSASGDWLYIGSHSYIKLSNDCFNAPGAGVSFATGYGTVTQTGGSHLTVDHVTILPTGCSAAYNQICAAATADNTNVSAGNNSAITNSLLAGGAESIHAGNNTTISGNYVNANGDVSGQHAENVYVSGAQGLTVTANTMFNPFNQTAVIFGDSASACTNQFVVTGNLMAGGGWPIYWCGNATSNSTGTLTFENNDLARCTTTPTNVTGGGTHYCGSTAPIAGSGGNVSAVGTSQDTHGFWPNSGGFGVDNYMLGCPSPAVSWSGNTWDDDGSTVAC